MIRAHWKTTALVWLLSVASAAQAVELLDGVAAIVDEQVILISELERAARPMLQAIEREQGPLSREAARQVRREALRNLIDDRLIRLVAKRLGLEATPEEIDTAIEGIAEEEKVRPEEIYAAAANAGLSRETYRKELGKQISRMKVIAATVRSRITVSDEDVRALFDDRYGSLEPGMRVQLRHILIPWPDSKTGTPRSKARELAQQVRTRALKGESFAELARTYSGAPSGAKGGATTLRESEVSPAIREEVFSLEPGAISRLLKTPHGLNLFQMVRRFDPADVRFEDVRDQLAAELIERRTKPEYEDWIEELRSERYIEIVIPELQ
ncbi:MAG: peptidylprolyl isomerase [Myxococcota bacterium]